MRILILLIIFITLPISAIAKGRVTPDASKACYKKCKATHGAVYPNKTEMSQECSGPSDKPLNSISGNLTCCHNCQILHHEIQMEEESVYSEPQTYDSSEAAVEPIPSNEELNERMLQLEETVNQLYMKNK
jgi:hypothetical protein